MNLIDLFIRFPGQEACIAHMEKMRWGGGTAVARKADGFRVGR